MGARILVVDDDAWILRMVSTVLEKAGHAVRTANDGEEAFEAAVAEPPDLMITDVMMPRMDGWVLVKALRARPELAFTPVIFLTALTADDDRIKGFRLGADDYLPKPFRFEELELRVAKTLRQNRAIEVSTRQAAVAVEPDTVPIAAPALAGELEQVGLSALLTLLELERKTGLLTVTNGNGTKAVLSVRMGRVVACSLGGFDSDEESVYALLRWTAGRFAFEPGDVTGDDRVNQTTTHLLMEGARRIDEQAHEASG